MLKIEKLTIKFGGLVAINEVSMDIQANKICGLIGPNGAGKTTLFNLISGVLVPDSGSIIFQDEHIEKLKPFQVNKKGISRTYQAINLFDGLSVLDNVLVGMHTTIHASFVDDIFNTKRQITEEKRIKEEAMVLLEDVGLKENAKQLAGRLPYGKKRQLEIVRALGSSPKMLLLDEPAAGMNATEKAELHEYMQRILSKGITIFLIEHDMKLVMNVVDYLYVINFGKKIAQGTASEVRENPEVITAYLGGA